MSNKDEMRREIRLCLAGIYAGEEGRALRNMHSRQICDAIRTHSAWQRAQLVCAFLPLSSEPQISPLWEETEMPFCFPRIHGQELKLVRIADRDVLRRANWKMSLPEFETAPVVELGEVDLLLVPGVAFTREGARLGRGGGYYDRLLAGRMATTFAAGVCYSAQIVDALVREAHDMPVDAVVTEMRE